MPFDSSEARKTKTSVTSAGFAHSVGSSWGSAARCIAVFMLPGSTQLTRTFVSSNSDALVCDYLCLRREFARVIANLAQLIAVSGDKRKSTRTFARKSQRHFAPESLRCPGDENVFAR